MQKRVGKVGTVTARGDARRRIDSFNVGTQIAVVGCERNIQSLIRTARGIQVMLDRDMARL